MDGLSHSRNELDEKFCKDFWEKDCGSYGENLIERINEQAPQNKFLIRKELRNTTTRYYCIAVDKTPDKLPSDVINDDWTLCKVGITRSGREKSSFRVNQVKKQIGSQGFNPSTTFVLLKSAVDVTEDRELEKKIRSKVGLNVASESAKDLNLPFPTEWVLTPTKFFKNLNQQVENKGYNASSTLLHNCNFKTFFLTNFCNVPKFWESIGENKVRKRDPKPGPVQKIEKNTWEHEVREYDTKVKRQSETSCYFLLCVFLMCIIFYSALR